MIQMTDFQQWDNNVNTGCQKDKRGNVQNIAYYDADDGMQIGPNDPRLTLINQVPLNFFRPHVVSEFDEVSLDPKWTTSLTGSAYMSYSNSEAIIHTGTTNGSGCEMAIPNAPMYFVAGQRVYFYLYTTPNGNLDLEFGVKYDANNLIRFRRIEDSVAQPYYSETLAGGVSTVTNNLYAGDSVRRLFCIETTSTGVNFYISTDAGELILKSTHTTNIPTGQGHIYLKFFNRYAAERSLHLDTVYAVRIK